MTDQISKTFDELDRHLRKSSIAQIGGFRPPDDPLSSWFGGKAVALPNEELPIFKDVPMFPLLQVNCSELPFVPTALKDIAVFVVYLNNIEIPFDKPHGDGWLIREYSNMDSLVPLKNIQKPDYLKDFPIKWELSETEGPDWEDAWGLVDLTPINESEEASDQYYDRYSNHSETKIGGFPSLIQHSLGGNSEFVFQIGSEEKPNWMWVDNGIGYFLKNQQGFWEFQCQFY